MKKALRLIASECVPPVLLRGVRSLLTARRSSQGQRQDKGLRPPEWYDSVYDSSLEYRKHYTQSIYYFVWTVVADRIVRSSARSILDLGCGPGQFASLLYDRGLRKYCGLDFSAKSIDLARQKCPAFEFRVADISKTDLLESHDYDCAVSLEFLEHVEDDIGILARLRPGTRFFGTVPNHPYVSHVRHFLDEEEVRARYQDLFSSFRVDSILREPNGVVYYLMEGTKS